MKKQIFYGYWFYNVIALAGILISLTSVILCTIGVAYFDGNSENLIYLYLTLILCSLATIAITVLVGFYIVRITVLTEKGIKVRCLWSTVRSLEWVEVKEVRYESLDVSVIGAYKSGWYVFDDGAKRPIKNGITRKNGCIAIPASKRAKRVLENLGLMK